LITRRAHTIRRRGHSGVRPDGRRLRARARRVRNSASPSTAGRPGLGKERSEDGVRRKDIERSPLLGVDEGGPAVARPSRSSRKACARCSRMIAAIRRRGGRLRLERMRFLSVRRCIGGAGARYRQQARIEGYLPTAIRLAPRTSESELRSVRQGIVLFLRCPARGGDGRFPSRRVSG